MELHGDLDLEASQVTAAKSSPRKRKSQVTRKVTVRITEKIHEQLQAATADRAHLARPSLEHCRTLPEAKHLQAATARRRDLWLAHVLDVRFVLWLAVLWLVVRWLDVRCSKGPPRVRAQEDRPVCAGG